MGHGKDFPWVAALIVSLLVAAPVFGQSRLALTHVGRPEIRNGLRVVAGYLPGPVPLDPPGGPIPSGPAIHLQVDVDAIEGNPYGFEPDDSVPYLQIPFTLVFVSTGWRHEGTLEPMVSRDGFHYGATVPVPAEGDYRFTIEVRPPQGLARHADPSRGVSPWWTPFQVTWQFHYPEGP